MADADTVLRNEVGVDTNGNALPWRVWAGRAERNIGDIVNNPNTQEWNNTYNGRAAGGTADQAAQVKMIAEQLAYTHTYSDGVKRDPGDIFIALGEFLVAQGVFKK